MHLRKILFGLLASGLVSATACGGGSTPSPQTGGGGGSSPPSSPIQHVVLVIQENRTFNNFFATYPGADGTTTGLIARSLRCQVHEAKAIPLKKANLVIPKDLNHNYQGYQTSRNGGKMDGFDRIMFSSGMPECRLPYQYVDPSQIQPYWEIAQHYVLAEHMFSSQGSSSFTGHQDLIAGGTIVAPHEAMVNLPTCSGSSCRWGCDAPPGTKTSLISNDDVFKAAKGPFPCTANFSVPYPTMRDLLDAANVSWKYYVPRPCCSGNGRLFTAYDVEHSVRYGPEWKTNISSPQTNIFGDISGGELPAVSWVIPDGPDSDHPGYQTDNGPAWVGSIVNAIGESSYWDSTAIVIVWDDWGGLYDNINPQQVGYGGLGFRVPALIVSAYARAGLVSQTNYEFASILRYIEDNWRLGTLDGRDRHATSIIDCFDYSQRPIKFVPIALQHSKEYFMNRKSSGLPPDNDM